MVMLILLNYEIFFYNFVKNIVFGRIYFYLLFRYVSKSKEKYFMFILKYLFLGILSDFICLFFVQVRKCICFFDGFDYFKGKLDLFNCSYMCSDIILLLIDCGGEMGFNVFFIGDILKWLYY